jgi:hypothetical protein
MAIACFGLVTFLRLRPLLSWPCFISCISSFTYSPALGLYFLPRPLLEEDLRDVFFAAEPRRDVLARFFAVVLVLRLRVVVARLRAVVFFAEVLRLAVARVRLAGLRLAVVLRREVDFLEREERFVAVAMLCLLIGMAERIAILPCALRLRM